MPCPCGGWCYTCMGLNIFAREIMDEHVEEPTQRIPDELMDSEHMDSSDPSSQSDPESDGEEPEQDLFASTAGKRPRGSDEPVVDGEGFKVPSRGRPDIAGYLRLFNLDAEQQIAICRTWANYLNAQLRPKKYKKGAAVPKIKICPDHK